jgi:hypothetical protein
VDWPERDEYECQMARRPDHRQLEAEALQALRKSLGFRSATSAAEAHGWPAARYRSHESGARPILEADAKRYAKAYKADPEILLNPRADRVDQLIKMVRAETDAAKSRIAERLRCSRILAGFDSATEAATILQIAPATFVKHESAEHRLSSAALELYAHAFGIKARWLADGTLPSGFGRSIDSRIMEAIASPLEFRQMRSPRRPVDPELIDKLKDALVPGRPPALVGIPEFRWEDLERARGKITDLKPREMWNVPSSFAPRHGSGNSPIFIVTVETGRDGAISQEWFFVGLDFSTEDSEQDHLLLVNGKLDIGKGVNARGRSATVLGTIIGRLRHPFRSN